MLLVELLAVNTDQLIGWVYTGITTLFQIQKLITIIVRKDFGGVIWVGCLKMLKH